MNPAQSDELILRYIAGTATDGEVAQVRQLLAANAQRRGAVSGLHTALRAEDIDGTPPDPDAALAVFLQRLQRESQQASEKPSRQSVQQGGEEKVGRAVRMSLGGRPLRRWTGLIVAAAAIVIVLISSSHGMRERLTTRTYATGVGQQATILLDDGTHVTLAPHTTLRLAKFGLRSRTVELDGQALFDVAQSTEAPFLIHTGTVTTRVLGTTFLVRHYTDQSPVHVAVIDGKIHISSPTLGRGVTLAAGAIGDIADTTADVQTVEELAPGTEWQRGKLVFHHTPVASILQTLGRWYGYQFRCADSTLAQQKFTMVVNMQSAPVALATLEEILGVNLAIVGDTVTLTASRARPTSGTPRVRSYDVWTPIKEVGR